MKVGRSKVPKSRLIIMTHHLLVVINIPLDKHIQKQNLTRHFSCIAWIQFFVTNFKILRNDVIMTVRIPRIGLPDIQIISNNTFLRFSEKFSYGPYDMAHVSLSYPNKFNHYWATDNDQSTTGKSFHVIKIRLSKRGSNL